MSEEQVTQSMDVRGDCETQDKVQRITSYLMESSPEFRRLTSLRQEGWSRAEGDRYFQRQRKNADHANERTKAYFFQMMKNMAVDMQHSMGALKLHGGGHGGVLDTCLAPGGFLSVVLEMNPHAAAVAFTLPSSAGGHNVLLPPSQRVTTHFIDITMLAEDLGVTDIPASHPDARNFLPRQLPPEQMFDLVICDGQVLRTHHRPEYREHREARRLTVAQLALGLRHLRQGGSMVVLLHKAEAPDTVSLLRKFSQFSCVRLYKSSRYHATRSSFYMIATCVMGQSSEAAQSVADWEATWRTATFGTEEDYMNLVRQQTVGVKDTLGDFGPKLVSMAADIWSTQADALVRAPFMTKKG